MKREQNCPPFKTVAARGLEQAISQFASGVCNQSSSDTTTQSRGPELPERDTATEPITHCDARAFYWPEKNAPPDFHGFLSPFPPLQQVTRPTVPTDAAAYYLNRAPQTMRKWACLENGPLRPIRINGRLAWRVSDLQSLLSGGAK